MKYWFGQPVLLTAGRKPRGGFVCLNVHNGQWRETPLFRHWRKCRQLSLARGWRKRYRRFRLPVAYSKARARAGIRYRQTEPPRETERSGRPSIDDSRPLRVEEPRGYRRVLYSSSKTWAMVNATCRNWDRNADAGAYCSSCAVGITASALNPQFRGRRKRLPLANGGTVWTRPLRISHCLEWEVEN